MKNIEYILFALLILTISCSEEKPETWSGEDRLNFVQKGGNKAAIAADTVVLYTFVFEPESVVRDTIWVEVKAMGAVRNYPRPLKLKQMPSSGLDAVAGVHYVDFNDSELRDSYTMPAGEMTAKLPIILLRNQLGDEYHFLRIGFEANEHFLPGYDHLSHRMIRISDILSKPDNWNNTVVNSLFGTYNQEKHQFMIDVTGLAIDDAYIQAILDTKDTSYYTFLNTWYTNKLNEANSLLPEGEKYTFAFNK